MSDMCSMQEKILFVDDDQNILDAFRRNFRKDYALETATSVREAAKIIAQKGPFAVVVSDMRMPKVDGVQFLTRLKEICPDTVRIMLTGYADMQSSIAAVNEGSVFRFLTKPCTAQNMKRVLEDALRQYRLVVAEKQLLEQTLSGSIKVLTELLAMVNPDAFGRANRIHRLVRQIALHLGVTKTWEMENAALLSQIGCMLLPSAAMQQIIQGESLDGEPRKIYDIHPVIAADLLSHIPRLDTVREFILYQEKRFDGEGTPLDGKSGADIPLGGRILKILVDFDQLEHAGKNTEQALHILRAREGWYDPRILDVLEKVLSQKTGYRLLEMHVHQLRTGMVLAGDVQSQSGMLLVAQGQEVTPVLITRLRTYAEISGVQEPIRVLVPPVEQDDCRVHGSGMV
ncbi:HD domain-containing phosphohydrolase [Desulfonatronum thioautotrophicum]|uniref:HD domain-containing phosphohydrolase n=1 Tax=Desulfonatronum thioautotrophicum TaxID=617001 RepID=UPI000AF23B0A|nr:HD domain-containing phosphohydrolase [Desulfonatronum thioautotrophicum]